MRMLSAITIFRKIHNKSIMTFHNNNKNHKNFSLSCKDILPRLWKILNGLFWFWSSIFWQAWACSVMDYIWIIECCYFCFPWCFKYHPFWIVFEIHSWKLFENQTDNPKAFQILDHIWIVLLLVSKYFKYIPILDCKWIDLGMYLDCKTICKGSGYMHITLTKWQTYDGTLDFVLHSMT